MSEQRTIDPVACSPFEHDWQETYAGNQCCKCGLYVPEGCEPWLEPRDSMTEREADAWEAWANAIGEQLGV